MTAHAQYRTADASRSGFAPPRETAGPHGNGFGRRPFILGIGGTTRDGSTSERALRCSLAAASRCGADVLALTGRELMLPIYAPELPERSDGALHLIDLVRRCDGLIISSPGYHGSLSGMLKNALDYVEDLREDARPYLADRAVGLIVCAAGWQAVGTTLTSLRSIAHALRGWPTPVGAGLNTVDPAFDPAIAFSENRMHWQLEEIGRQVAEFAKTRMLREKELVQSHGGEAG